MGSHTQTARRTPGTRLLGPFALAAFGAAALVGLHGRAGADAAADEPTILVEAPAVAPGSRAPASPSGRRRTTVTDPLWDNAVWYPGSPEPGPHAPGGDAFHP